MTPQSFTLIIATRLKDIIQYKNVDIRHLSMNSSVSKAQIYRILSANCDTTITTLAKLLISLGVPLDNFFNFSIPVDSVFNNVIITNTSDMLELLAKNLRIQQANLSRLKGLTQARIAENLNLADYKYISYILNGKNRKYVNIKISTLINLCMQLEIENALQSLFSINQGGPYNGY